MAQASTTPDIRRIEKTGKQVGTIIRDGIELSVFRYDLFLSGISDKDFANGNSLVIRDIFNTNYLKLVDVSDVSRHKNTATAVAEKGTLTADEQTTMGVSYWDQGLKGYSKTNRWVGPVRATVEDYVYSGTEPSQMGDSGLTFTITETDFMTLDSRGRNGLDPDSETGEYCLRYSLTYYLMVKDGNKAKELATLSEAELAAQGITKEGDRVSFSNIASWNGVEEKAVADAGTEFKPVSKSVVYNEETDIASFRVVLNPQALRLNEGQMIRVEDEYNNLAVDFSTVTIVTEPPERASQVDWSYHSNKGTFWIPDETMVIITYEATPIGDPGKNTTFNNSVTMSGFPPETVSKTVTLNSESEGTAGDYNIRLYKYQDNSMNKPLGGAVFQLFEDGDGSSGDVNVSGKYYKPVRYAAANNRTEPRYTQSSGYSDFSMLTAAGYPTREKHEVGDFIYFGTTSMGYADIHLRQDEDGLALDRGKQYYLREIQVPTGFAGETMHDSVTDTDVPLFWSFIIDDMDYFDQVNQIFVYRDNGILTVSNTSQDQGIVIRKHFAGDITQYEDQKDITFEIVGRKKGLAGDEANWEIVFRKEILYSEFIKDNINGGLIYKIRPESLPNDLSSTYVYTITEKNADIPTFTRKTTVTTRVEDGPEIERVHETTATEVPVSLEISAGQIAASNAFRFDFTNIYEAQPVSLTFTKQWGTKAAGLHTKRAEMIIYRDGVPLYFDENDPLMMKPVPENVPEGVTAPEPYRFVLSTGTPTITVDNLPRYKHDGSAYEYSVREVRISYIKDGNTIVAEGDDLDIQFIILATAPDGVDDGGNPVYKNIPVSYGEAVFDTDHKDGVMIIENEVAELTAVQVKKTWYDENGVEDTTKTDDDAVLFDLYRTTRELPKGGSDRETYNILPQTDTNGATVLTNTLEVKEGDLIDITVTGLSVKYPSWSQVPIYEINFGGLFVWTTYVAPFEYEGITYASRWAYNFDVEGVYDTDGNDISSDYQILRHESSNGVHDLSTMFVSSYNKPRQVIVVRVRVAHLDWIGGSYRGKLFIRNVSATPCTVTLENYTQKQESLNREKLEGMVSDENLKPFRTGIELNRTNSWVYLNNLPKDDGKGNVYTYFAIERQPAGYQDAYEIQVDEEGDGTSTILMSNTPIDATDPANLGTLKVSKHISGLPPSIAASKEYSFTVQNGFKYLVDTGGGHYELMTRAAAEAAGRQIEFTLREGETNAKVFNNLLPGSYTIRETRLTEAAVEHYDMDVAYVRNGATSQDFVTATVLKSRTSDATIVNTYTPVFRDFAFGKLWITGQDLVPITWPKDEKITVRLLRSSGGSEDASFYLDMELSGDAAIIVDSDGGEYSDGRSLAAGTPGRYNDYTWTVSGLEEYDDSGQPYTYYVKETNNTYSYEKLYGILRGATAVPEDPAVKSEATDDEFIINRISQTGLTFTKEWFDGRDKILIDH
ncbi:MAG: Cna B-type domain-containing protein, partial [Lachnospiraceae bacterium]|nr:Cna B-type domain-containing protein [Lachnospiraceae bacterium]